jgi:soluble lytic murein transglycosylase-like protein
MDWTEAELRAAYEQGQASEPDGWSEAELRAAYEEGQAKADPAAWETAASQFLGGVSDLGGALQTASDMQPGNLVKSAIYKALGIEEQTANISDLMNQGFDKATGIEGSTKIGEDTLIGKFSRYLPGSLIGPGGIGTKLVGNALSSVGGYLGSGYGPVGEAIGAALVPMAGGASARATGYAAQKLGGLFGAGELSSTERPVAKYLAEKLGTEISALPETSVDPFYSKQTLAEVLQNPELAMIQQDVTKSGAQGNNLLVANQDSRRALQMGLVNGTDDLTSALSSQKPTTREAAGGIVRGLIEPERNAARDVIGTIYDVPSGEVPRAPVEDAARQAVSKLYESGGVPGDLSGMVRDLASNPTDTRPYSWMNAFRRRAQTSWKKAKANGDAVAAEAANSMVKAVDNAIELAGEKGLMSRESVDAFEAAKAAHSDYARKFRSGGVGAIMQDMGQGNYTMPESRVVTSAFNGSPERTRALLDAIPGEAEAPGAIDRVRGVVRDLFVRETTNTDGNFLANKARRWIKDNQEGLTARSSKGDSLFDKDHMSFLQQLSNELAYFDSGSSKSVKNLANRASVGQPTTAQAIFNQGIANRLVSKVPYLDGAIKWMVSNRTEAINGVWAKAIFDKNFAKALVSKATSQSLENSLESLGRAVSQTGKQAVSLGGLSGALRSAGVLSSENDEQSQLSAPQGEPASELSGEADGQAPVSSSQAAPTDKQESRILAQAVVPSRDPFEAKLERAIEQAQEKTMPTDEANPADKKVSAPERLVEAVIKQESAGKPKAVSHKGARGLMQLMPETAKEVAAEMGLEDYDLEDPDTNRAMGTYYLNKMLKQFGGDEELALAGYNAGPGRVRKWIAKYGPRWKDIEPEIRKRDPKHETLKYVTRIMDDYKQIEV